MRKITALIYIAVAWTPTGATTSHRQHISAQDEIVIDPPKPADDATLESTNRTDVHCDIATEETCYSHDGNYTPEYCAKLSDGGCPCASGEVKCGYGRYSSGYCTAVCCDPRTEETCYDGKLRPVECKRFGEGGCGCSKTKKKKDEKERTQVRCGFSETDPGYCADVCCDEITEETCVGDDGELYCAKYSDGGCPCEDEDDVKCGYSEYFPGYCTKVCCDPTTEQTCYDSNWNPLWCAKISWGGCPCPEGQEKCGASENYAGYCVDMGTCPGRESDFVTST